MTMTTTFMTNMRDKPLTNTDLYGIVRGISNADYHAGAGVSKSDLDLLAVTPAHYKAHKENPEPPTEAMQTGTAFHTFVLEPERFREEYVIKPKFDMRTKAGKEGFEAWKAENAGKNPVDRETMDMLTHMRESLMGNPIIKKLVEGTEHELSAYTEIQDTLCKCRPDGWDAKNNVIIDLKSTADASAEGFKRAVSRRRYHVQAAWYMSIMRQIVGEPINAFYFFACEKTPPYACAIYELDAVTLLLGDALAMRDLERYREAIEQNCWKGYPQVIQELRLSAWELNQNIGA